MSERIETARLVRELFWTVATQAAYAAALTMLSILGDRYVLWLFDWEYGIPLRDIDGGGFVDLCVAVAGITGVFLGLYFTAIGVVVGSVYSRVPSNVRALSIREKIGDRYLRFVALTCIYSLFVGTVDIIGFGASRFGLALLLILTCYSVFAFLELGLRVYRFFDPEVLAARINHETAQAMHYVAARSAYAHDRSFQTHYRERVEGALATYRSLFDIVNSPPPNLDASYELLDGHSALWFIYTNLKSEIPAASEWYRARSEFQSVLASNDDSMLEMRLGNAVLPEPSIVRDYLWFDDAIASTVADNLSVHFAHDDLDRPMRYLMSLQYRILSISELLATEEALLVERRVSAGVFAALVARKLTVKDRQIGTLIQVADFVGIAPMQVLLGTAARVRGIDPASLLDRTNWRSWYEKGDYHHDRLPRNVIARLETLRNQLTFERRVEGRVVTADWYLREQYVIALVGHVANSMNLSLQRLEASYVDDVTQLAEKVDARIAMHVALRGIETCHKFDVHSEAVTSWIRTMISHHVSDSQLTMPFDSAAFAARVEALRTHLLQVIASLTYRVYDDDARLVRELPDYFGFAYRLLSQELFARMARRDIRNFELLFRSTFGLSLLAHQRLKVELEGQPVETQVNYMTEPIAHVLELSGYALLFTNLYAEPTFWRVARAIWEGKSGDLLKPDMLIVIYELDADIAVRPWFNNRFNWSREFVDLLGQAIREERQLAPIIRAVANYLGRHPVPAPLDARYVFLLAYLRWQPGFADTPMRKRIQWLERELDHAFEEESGWPSEAPDFSTGLDSED